MDNINPEAVQIAHEAIADQEAVGRSLGDRIKNVGAITVFAFQQSPANEAIRACVGANIFDYTGNPLLVGAGVGVATMAIEGLSSLSIGAALQDEHGMVNRFKHMIKRGQSENMPAPNSSAVSDTAVMLGIGAGALVVKRHFEEPDRNLAKDVRTSVKASGFIAGFSGGVAGLASGGLSYASSVGLEKPAEIMINVLADGRTYIGLLGAAAITSVIKKGWHKLQSRRAANKSNDTPIASNYTVDSIDAGDGDI